MDLIKPGDTVTVYWTIGGEQFTGIVLHIPQYVGDMWQIKGEKGHVIAINPNCSNFEQIMRRPRHTGEKKGGK